MSRRNPILLTAAIGALALPMLLSAQGGAGQSKGSQTKGVPSKGGQNKGGGSKPPISAPNANKPQQSLSYPVESQLWGQWEGRIQMSPGQLPSPLSEKEKAMTEKSKRLIGATKVFLKLGPKGSCKLSSQVIGGPTHAETARWSLVGSVLRIERGDFKGHPRQALLGAILAAPPGPLTKFTLDLPGGMGRAKGRLVMVRTGYYTAPGQVPSSGAGSANGTKTGIRST